MVAIKDTSLRGYLRERPTLIKIGDKEKYSRNYGNGLRPSGKKHLGVN